MFLTRVIAFFLAPARSRDLQTATRPQRWKGMAINSMGKRGSTAPIEGALGLKKGYLGKNLPSLTHRSSNDQIFQENGEKWRRIVKAAEKAVGELCELLYPANPDALGSRIFCERQISTGSLRRISETEKRSKKKQCGVENSSSTCCCCRRSRRFKICAAPQRRSSAPTSCGRCCKANEKAALGGGKHSEMQIQRRSGRKSFGLYSFD